MTVTESSPQLAERYGRTPGRRRRNRILFIVVGVVFAAVLGGWIVWAGLDQGSGSIETQDTGARVLDDRSVAVSFRVSMAVGSTASCAIQVQNEDHAIVGWKIVEIAASEKYSNGFTETVRTAERGVTGLIYRCWLT